MLARPSRSASTIRIRAAHAKYGKLVTRCQRPPLKPVIWLGDFLLPAELVGLLHAPLDHSPARSPRESPKRRLTQAAAAALLNLDQPKVSALVGGRLAGFSLDRLVRLLVRTPNPRDGSSQSEITPLSATSCEDRPKQPAKLIQRETSHSVERKFSVKPYNWPITSSARRSRSPQSPESIPQP